MNSKNIVITGGSSGIGFHTALHFVKAGHEVFITSRNRSKLDHALVKLKSHGSAHGFAADVQDSHQVKSAFEKAVEVLGRIDLAVLNAGIGFFGNIESFTEEEYDLQFDTNVKGVFLWLQHLVPLMKTQGKGQIVVTSSNLGLETTARGSIYCATKHAVQAMVSCVRKELVGTGVKVATVNPGAVDTPWFDGKDVDKSKMLNVMDVVKGIELLANQSESSDIELIKILPTRRSM